MPEHELRQQQHALLVPAVSVILCACSALLGVSALCLGRGFFFQQARRPLSFTTVGGSSLSALPVYLVLLAARLGGYCRCCSGLLRAHSPSWVSGVVVVSRVQGS